MPEVTRVSQEPSLWTALTPFLMLYSLDDISAAAPSEELVPLSYRNPCNIIGLWNLRNADVWVTLGHFHVPIVRQCFVPGVQGGQVVGQDSLCI